MTLEPSVNITESINREDDQNYDESTQKRIESVREKEFAGKPPQKVYGTTNGEETPVNPSHLVSLSLHFLSVSQVNAFSQGGLAFTQSLKEGKQICIESCGETKHETHINC